MCECAHICEKPTRKKEDNRLHDSTAQKTAPPFFIKPAQQFAVRRNFQWRWQFNSSSQETWESDVSCVRTGSHYRSDPVRVQSTNVSCLKARMRTTMTWDRVLRQRKESHSRPKDAAQVAGMAQLAPPGDQKPAAPSPPLSNSSCQDKPARARGARMHRREASPTSTLSHPKQKATANLAIAA